MSVKLDIFNDVRDAIMDITGTPIKSFGFFNSQIDNEKREIPRTYPIVDLEFSSINWAVTNLKPTEYGSTGSVSKTQKSGSPASNVITLHIQFKKLKRATLSFPEYDPIIQKVYLAVQSLSGTYYGPLERIAELQDTDHDNVIDWQMQFASEWQECGEEDDSLEEIPGGTLTVEIVKNLDIDNDLIRTGDGTF